MDRLKKTVYKGKTIFVVDLSNTKPEDTINILPKAHALIASQPVKSVLILTDVTNAIYNKEAGERIKDFVKENSPYILASAVVGADDGIRQIFLNTVVFLTRRGIKTFADYAEAQDWLISQ